jgi:hypothetical protein
VKRRSAAAPAASIGSFAVYLLPLVGPHATWLVGEQLHGELSRLSSERSSTWAAVDLAVAAGAQAMLAVLLFWWWRRRTALCALAVAMSVPVFWLTLQWAYLVAIPERFLIEVDEARENLAWPTECFLPGLSLATVRTAPDLPLERAGRAWIAGRNGRIEGFLETCDLSYGSRSRPTIARSACPSCCLTGARCSRRGSAKRARFAGIFSAAPMERRRRSDARRPIRIAARRSFPTTASGRPGSSVFRARPSRRSSSR